VFTLNGRAEILHLLMADAVKVTELGMILLGIKDLWMEVSEGWHHQRRSQSLNKAKNTGQTARR